MLRNRLSNIKGSGSSSNIPDDIVSFCCWAFIFASKNFSTEKESRSGCSLKFWKIRIHKNKMTSMSGFRNGVTFCVAFLASPV